MISTSIILVKLGAIAAVSGAVGGGLGQILSGPGAVVPVGIAATSTGLLVYIVPFFLRHQTTEREATQKNMLERDASLQAIGENCHKHADNREARLAELQRETNKVLIDITAVLAAFKERV